MFFIKRYIFKSSSPLNTIFKDLMEFILFSSIVFDKISGFKINPELISNSLPINNHFHFQFFSAKNVIS